MNNNESTLNNEWNELYENYLTLSDVTYKLNIFDDNFFSYIEENSMIYIFEEIGVKKYMLEEYEDIGFNSKEETFNEWVSSYWSCIEVMSDMFNNSDCKRKEKIIQCFQTSIEIHMNSSFDFSNYKEFKSRINLELKENDNVNK